MPVNVLDARISASLDGDYIRKYGYNPSQGRNEDVIVWPMDTTDYPWPTAPFIPQVQIEEAGDVGKTLFVEGLSAVGLALSEHIVMEIGGVLMANQYMRLNRAFVMGQDPNEGHIDILGDIGEVLINIPPGDNQTQQLIYSVPIDKNLLLSTFIFTTSVDRDADFKIWVKTPSTPMTRKGDTYVQNGTTQILMDPYLKVEPLSDIYVTCYSNSTGKVACQMFGYLYRIGVNDG